jgi:hypothetical protein
MPQALVAENKAVLVRLSLTKKPCRQWEDNKQQLRCPWIQQNSQLVRD